MWHTLRAKCGVTRENGYSATRCWQDDTAEAALVEDLAAFYTCFLCEQQHGYRAFVALHDEMRHRVTPEATTHCVGDPVGALPQPQPGARQDAFQHCRIHGCVRPYERMWLVAHVANELLGESRARSR